MSAPLNIELEIYQTIWNLLEADPEWVELVPVGNRIRYDNVETDEDPAKEIASEGDFCQVMLLVKNGSTDLYTTDETFETHAPEGPSCWTEKHTYTFRLVLTATNLDLTELSELGTLTRHIIRQAGPRLGLSYITSVKLRFETDADVTPDNPERGTNAEQRHRQTIDVLLVAEPPGSTLGD